MGERIDLLTALIIQSNEVSVETYYSGTEKKYGFVISRMERSNYREVVSTIPLYSTKREAKRGGNCFVESVKKLDLSPEKSELARIMEREAEIISGLTKAVNPDS